MFETVEQAKQAHTTIYTEWRRLYSLTRNGREGTEDERALFASYDEALPELTEEILKQFGKVNPRYPDCKMCVRVSVFGGPNHSGSIICRSGGRAHCTCDLCF